MKISKLAKAFFILNALFFINSNPYSIVKADEISTSHYLFPNNTKLAQADPGDIQKGLDLYKSGDYSKAINEFGQNFNSQSY